MLYCMKNTSVQVEGINDQHPTDHSFIMGNERLFVNVLFANYAGEPSILLWRIALSMLQSSAPQWKDLTRITRSLWEPQEICGLKGVLTSLIMSLDRGIKSVKAMLSPIGFLLVSAY